MSFLDDGDDDYVEIVMAMPPLATAAIEALANELLREIAPQHLRAAQPLDVQKLIDYVLPKKKGIHFSPVNDNDLPDAYAKALHGGELGDDIEVVMRDTEWKALERGGRRAHHARASVAHELGHCILHVPVIRRRRALGKGLPRQYKATDIKAFRSAEWQAWCFGTCLLAPRKAILKAGTVSAASLADIFQTSERLMEMHLRRLGLTMRRAR